MKTPLVSALLALSTLAPAGDLLVSPAWLKENLNDPRLVLFHVGAKPDFEKEHIPGAQLVVPQDLSIPRADGALIFVSAPECEKENSCFEELALMSISISWLAPCSITMLVGPVITAVQSRPGACDVSKTRCPPEARAESFQCATSQPLVPPGWSKRNCRLLTLTMVSFSLCPATTVEERG